MMDLRPGLPGLFFWPAPPPAGIKKTGAAAKVQQPLQGSDGYGFRILI